MCLEFLRRFIARHKTVWCPSKTSEDGIFLCFFLVDLSRRRVVLLRGGPHWKGSGGIITYTFSPSAPPSPLHFGASSAVFIYMQKRRIPTVVVLGLAVVLLLGAVVPQAPAVVPHEVAVVP